MPRLRSSGRLLDPGLHGYEMLSGYLPFKSKEGAKVLVSKIMTEKGQEALGAEFGRSESKRASAFGVSPKYRVKWEALLA